MGSNGSGSSGNSVDSNGSGGPSGGSPFVTLSGGTGLLVDTLAAAVCSAPSVEVRLGARVETLEPDGPRPALRLAGGEVLRPDAIILATPAPLTAGLLDGIAPVASGHLRTIPHGSTAVVSLAYRADQFPAPLVGHGFLVADGEPLTISACTWSSLKWAGRAPAGTVLLRAFIGSSGERLIAGTDDEIAAAAKRDVASTMGARGEPILTRIGRWAGAMPHYTVGHLDRVAAASAALGDLPNVVLAGSAYRGVGLPDCIAQGRSAAARVTSLLAGASAAP